MGYRNREDSFAEDHSVVAAASASSLGEALLFTTMCIIGLPVDVHVKDGSVFSGIFYTASVDGDYGALLLILFFSFFFFFYKYISDFFLKKNGKIVSCIDFLGS